MKKNFLVFVLFLFVFLLAVPVQAGNLAVSPALLLPTGAGVANFPFQKWNDEFYFAQASSTFDDAMMLAPLNLPNGVTLKQLTIYVTRNTGDGDIYITVYLMRHELATGAMETMATIYTWGLPASAARTSLFTRSLSYKTVNNSKYTYSLEVGFSRPVNTLKFHGAKITW